MQEQQHHAQSKPLAQKTSTAGWGLHPVVAATVRRARYRRDLLNGTEATVLAQGNCRSYGDACLYDNVVSMLPLKHLLSFDAARGLLRAEAGVTISLVGIAALLGE